MSIHEAIDLLQTYTGEAELTLHDGANESLLLMVEKAYDIVLPDDFKLFYRFSNGFETDEDIFNMIPIEEIIDNRSRNGKDPLYIAEYMIYSDMWQLEINPDDCNDYKIIVQSNYNELVLTQSLAEFIERFLNGGVFGKGGLYEWHQEVESQQIYTTKLKTTESLLTFFYYGLIFNIISKKEINDWADSRITHENEPEFFFIELSLSHDKNELISLLHSKCKPNDHIVARAILGLLYQRLSNGIIDVLEAITIMNKYDFANLLTRSETIQIYDITDEICMNELMFNKVELTQKALNFLAYYKEFDIAKYKCWLGLSSLIEYQFTEEERKLNMEPPGRKNKYKIKLMVTNKVVYVLALISLIVVITTDTKIENNLPLSKGRSDLYQLSQSYFSFFICYYVLKAGVWLAKKIVAGFKRIVS